MAKQLGVLAFGILIVAGSGCRKVENPNPTADAKRGYLFLNYYIASPTQKIGQPKKGDSGDKLYSGSTLKVFAWTNYLPPSVLEAFTAHAGAGVTLATYDSETELHDRLAGGEVYDVIMPAGFMLQRMIQEKRLAKLDPKALPNLSKIDAVYRTNVFDRGYEHGIPYVWSTAGIAYNRAHLDHIPRKWTDLFEPNPKIAHLMTNRISLLPEGARAMAAALIHLGHSPNTHETNELNAAANYLEAQARKFGFRFLRGQLPEALASGSVLLAEAYGHHAALAASKNPDVHFVLPEDGVWRTVDFLAIPIGTPAHQKALAENFLNFLLDPVIAGAVATYSYHGSTIHEARAYISPQVKHGPAYAHAHHPMQQMFDAHGARHRQMLWERIVNDLKIPTFH